MSERDDSDDRAAWSQPHRPARIGLAVIAAFVLAIGGWSALAPLSDAAIAQGSVQVEGRWQSVQHPYGGVVKEIAVTEGQHVEKGDVLVTLSDTEPRAERDVLVVEKAGLAVRRQRLIAEREGAADFEPPAGLDRIDPATLEEAVASERALMAARRRQHESAVTVIERRIEQLQTTREGAEVEAEGLERQIALTEEELDAARTLLEQGYTPRPRVLGLERDVAQLRSALAAKRAEIASAAQAVAEAQAEIAGLERSRLAAITEELRDAEAALSAVEPKIAAAEDALLRTDIRAPASGEIVALSVFTEGGVVAAGAPLMEIVPSAAPFFVDARLRLTELHGIAAGQRAEIQLLSAPRSVRPDLSGLVETVSADRLEDERTGEGYYAIQVRLDADDVAASDFALQAGMPVQVVMPTQARTLIDYLTSPLFDEFDTAFREP
ncbi:MAG: HlyD family type I secretion periplasmic adaptor subunit [Rhizobiaceae bacterium]|nr:HlyD family type I secretion periplasmic adaptor subunit [Rhizobiaceae bacterium]